MNRKIIIASNRIPFVLEQVNGEIVFTPGSGGLVTAMAPVLKDRGGTWIGWPGTHEKIEGLSDALARASREAGFSLVPVTMNADEIHNYYQGLSNEVLWPLFHDLQSYCNFEPSYWTMYREINARFASVISGQSGPEDFIWVHDYHLICVASELRKIDPTARIGFFLHIPFPPPDIFIKLPWRWEFARALLDYDLIGFQTLRDRRNFTQCLRKFFKDIKIKGSGRLLSLEFEGRENRTGSFPISIDYNEFAERAQSKTVADRAWFIHEDIPQGKIILGVDRLDYTKGIPYRLKAFSRLLEKHPELHRKITLVQIVVPSRRSIPMYEELKTEIERTVSEINGRFTYSGWVPIHYIFRSLSRDELLAYYRASEIALITPLKDGMNLVAKEYCASSVEKTGVLILSEFAGSIEQLHRGALIVNPYNVEEVADSIYEAYNMPENEQKARMKKMQQVIVKHDIFWWVDSFLGAAFSVRLDDYPILDEFSLADDQPLAPE